MLNRMKKGAAVAALAGSMLFGGGCLNAGWWWNAIEIAAVASATEFVLDNDTVFDLFEDGGTGTTE